MDDLVISIICTNNRSALEGCLSSLPAACELLRWRATVVDNASEDGTADMVREGFPWARLLRNTRRLGFSANHNRTLIPLVADCSARYAMILNDDTRLDPGAVNRMVDSMDAAPSLGAIGPAMRGADGAPQQSLFAFPTALKLATNNVRPRRARHVPDGAAGWLNGSCVLLRIEALAEVGSLDERFFIFFEDADLGLRLMRAGWRSAVCPDAGMVHLEHQTVSVPTLSSAMERQMLRSQWLYVRKHYGPTKAALMALGVRGGLLLRSASAALRGQLSRDAERTERAAFLLGLALSRPANPLSHERP